MSKLQTNDMVAVFLETQSGVRGFFSLVKDETGEIRGYPLGDETPQAWETVDELIKSVTSFDTIHVGGTGAAANHAFCFNEGNEDVAPDSLEYFEIETNPLSFACATSEAEDTLRALHAMTPRDRQKVRVEIDMELRPIVPLGANPEEGKRRIRGTISAPDFFDDEKTPVPDSGDSDDEEMPELKPVGASCFSFKVDDPRHAYIDVLRHISVLKSEGNGRRRAASKQIHATCYGWYIMGEGRLAHREGAMVYAPDYLRWATKMDVGFKEDLKNDTDLHGPHWDRFVAINSEKVKTAKVGVVFVRAARILAPGEPPADVSHMFTCERFRCAREAKHGVVSKVV